MKCVLSICVPTYNRSAFLAECLQSVVESAGANHDEIEIVVSDNAGVDNTEEIVRNASGGRLAIRYIRQPVNIGAQANFRALASEARGDYIWLLGDDDKLSLAAVGAVLGAIRGGADAVVCNVALHSRDFKRIIKSRFVRRASDFTFRSPAHAMETLGAHAGYISAAILPRRAFLDVPEAEYASFEEDGACFLFAIYCCFRSCRKIAFIASPVVLNRGEAPESDFTASQGDKTRAQWLQREDTSGWNRIFVHGMPRTLEALTRHGYSAGSVRAAKSRMVFDYMLPRLMLMKNMGHGANELAIAAFRHFKSSWAFWMLFAPSSCLPAGILRIAGQVRRSLINKQKMPLD